MSNLYLYCNNTLHKTCPPTGNIILITVLFCYAFCFEQLDVNPMNSNVNRDTGVWTIPLSVTINNCVWMDQMKNAVRSLVIIIFMLFDRIQNDVF